MQGFGDGIYEGDSDFEGHGDHSNGCSNGHSSLLPIQLCCALKKTNDNDAVADIYLSLCKWYRNVPSAPVESEHGRIWSGINHPRASGRL